MNKQKLLVIASYPPYGKTHDRNVVGIASYTKNTLVSLRSQGKKRGLAITVLAEKLSDKPLEYKEDGILIKRIWQRNSLLAFPLLLWEILSNHRATENILIEFEHAMFGEMLYLTPLPLFLLLLKILGKKVIFVSHQVIADISEIAPHINIAPGSLRTDIFNALIKLFYVFILRLSSKVIVSDEALKERLLGLGDSNKISVIPHGVEQFQNLPTKKEARKQLEIAQNHFVVLSFGYLAWYKGTDWLVETFGALKHQKIKTRIRLVLAGGPNPNHLEKNYYKKYVANIQRECRKTGILLTGFIPEDQIPLYFQACDLVILPYRTLISSSGPLSLAFSFQKPFLISDRLSKIFETQDLKEALKKAKLNKEKLTFELDEGVTRKIREIMQNHSLQKKIKGVTKALSQIRSWVRIGSLYYNELFS